MDRLAQRATTDAGGTCQFGLGNLAARRDIASHDCGLDTPEDVLGKGFRIVLNQERGFELIEHIVDTFEIYKAKTNKSLRLRQRKIEHCRQSSKIGRAHV